MRITSSKYFSKYYNGDTYASNLTDFSLNSVGVVQEQKMLSQIVEIDVASYANFGASFDVQSNRITRLAGSFIGDGFSIGDEFTASYVPTGGTNIQFTATITALTSQRLDFTGKVDTVGVYADASTETFNVYLLSPLYGFQMNYNFIENSDPITYGNFIDGTQMGWYADNVGIGGTRSTSFVNATQLGTNKSWYNGSLKVRYIDNVGHIQRFELQHEFIILPFYQDSEITNLQTLTPPASFFGGASLKYISKLDFRRVLSDPNSSKQVDYDNILGSIGWFNEPFNGFSMPFSFTGLSYLDSLGSTVSEIKVGDITTINFTIDSTASSFSTSTKLGLNVSFLPDLAEMQRTTEDFRDNFLFDTVYGIADSSTNVPSPLNQIQESTITFVNVNQITVQLKVLFSDSRLTNIDNYIISCEVASDSTTNSVNDKTNLLIDVNTFEKSTDILDLWDVDTLEFELYQDAKGTYSYTDFKGWIEDSINVSFTSWLDISKNAFLNDLSLEIVAYNPTTNDSFTISETIVPLSGVVVSGEQVFSTDQVAGFNFLTKNDYNIIKFTNTTPIGSKVYYEGEVSIKLDWQKWIALIGADTVFYDASKDKNGLNKNSSNYSLSNGYEVRVNVVAVVEETTSGIDTTYRNSNAGSKVYDYDLDGNVTSIWSGIIETFNSLGVNLSGALLISGVTTIKAKLNTTGTLGVPADYFGWISLEPINSTSKNSIEIYNGTITIVGSDLFIEYQLPSSEIIAGVQYKTSARLRELDIACTTTLSFSDITHTATVDTFFTNTNALTTDAATIVVKKGTTGAIIETLTGTVSQLVSSYTTDLVGGVSIKTYFDKQINFFPFITFDWLNYSLAVPFWATDPQDFLTFEITIDCKTETLTLITF